MRVYIVLFVTAALSKLSAACGCHQQQIYDSSTFLSRRSKPGNTGEKTILNNVRVFDGCKIGNPETIYIDGEFISEGFPPCVPARVVDGEGKILIPGLMDAHIHVPDVPGLENLTSWGVTTAFNMACKDYLSCHALADYPKSPEGAGIANLFWAGLAANANNSATASLFNTTGADIITEFDDPTEYVQRAFRNGSDYYKIVSKSPPLAADLQNGLVAAAHQESRQTMTHAADLLSYELAIDSGTDGLQHMPDDGLLSDDLIQKIVATNGQQFSTPTLNIFKVGYSNPLIAQLLRPNNTNGSYEHVAQNTAALHEAGVLILAGTDAVGSFYTPLGVFTVPLGPTLHSELEWLVEAGLSTVEALRAATINVAVAHRLHDRGSIEVGKRADLVLLNADPLANITNTKKIARVWVGGVEYPDIAGEA